MKSNLFLTLLLVGIFTSLEAQFVHSYLYQPGQLQVGRTDTAGNVYLAIDLDGDTLGAMAYPNPTSSGLGIAKFDKNGVFQWSSMATEVGYFRVLDMDVDAGGNIVFVGQMADSIRWGGFFQQDLNIMGAQTKLLVGLMDSTGTLQWLHDLNTNDYHGGGAINFLPNGDIAWGMGYTGATSFNGYNLPLSSWVAGYLLVINRNAVVQSAHHLDANGDAFMWDVVGGPNQDIWFSGTFAGDSATFLGTTIQGNGSGSTSFIGKVGANGSLQWVTAFTQGAAHVRGLDVDEVGNCYFAGSIFGTATIGGISLACPPGAQEMLAGKLQSNGTCSWAVASQSSSNQSDLESVDYHPDYGLLCGGIAKQGTGTFAGMPFAAGQSRSFFAVLDSQGVGTASILLDTTVGSWSAYKGQWADSGLVFYAGHYPHSGGKLLGTVLPTPPNQAGSFAARISIDGNHLMGKVYADLDQNGTLGAGDVRLPYHPVTKSGGLTVVTDPQGRFEFVVGAGVHTVTTASMSPLYHVQPPTATVTFVGPSTVDSSTVFRLVPTAIVPDLRLDLVAPPWAQPGQVHPLHLLATNPGAQAASGTITLELDPHSTFISANPAPDTILGPHLAWNVGPISPFGQHTVTVLVKLDSLLSLNDTLRYFAALNGPVQDFDLGNQHDTAHVEVFNAYDPNDKTVSPAMASSAYVNAGGRLRYVVRFQNTGTAPAHRVIIRDTLPSLLDPKTFRFVGASHPVDVRMYNPGILHFVFEPISLPDSSTDALSSQGYVVFEIATVTGLTSQTLISNRAGIYFDFNAPILTGEAVF